MNASIFKLWVGLVFAICTISQAENWPRFRGLGGQGHSQEKHVPIHWGPGSNIVWQVEIPGEGWSSPIVWESKVFLTATTENGASCRVICIDRQSGAILWNKEVFKQVPLRKEGKNSYATPTPVTDGKVICAVFGGGGAAALNFEGAVLWTNQEVQFYSRHGLGASPLIYAGKLIMPYDGSNRVQAPGQWPKVSDDERLGWQIPWEQSFIAALDLTSGRRVWTAKRGKSRIAHVSPNILREGGRAELISPAGDVIQGFDPDAGERRWTVFSQGEGVTPSFAFGDGLIFTSSGFEKTTLRAVRTGGRGDVTATHIAWEQRKGTPTLPSLLYVSPFLYAITEGGIAHCYDGKTGEIRWEERIGGNHSASPVYTEGRIYFLSESGESAVIQASPEFKLMARNSLPGKFQASFAISQGSLFARSDKHLFRIGGNDRK